MAAGTKRSIPDDSFYPDARFLRIIPSGSLFVRIYDYQAAARGGYQSHTFNPRRIAQSDDLPSWRGRYSPVERDPRFDSLYLAEYQGSEAVAVREYIDYEKLQTNLRDGGRYIRRDQVVGYAAAYFESTRDLQLVDFTSAGSCVDRYGADQEILEGHDSSITRLWARWVVQNAHNADGIMYRSYRFGSDVAGFPLVLFGDPGSGDCSFLSRYQPEVRLEDQEGYDLLQSIADQTLYYPETPWN